MIALPDRVWIARREYQRFDGIEHVEVVIYHEGMVEAYREEGYEVTEFVSYTRMRGLIHAASTTGRSPADGLRLS